jgi:hypothetical protein
MKIVGRSVAIAVYSAAMAAIVIGVAVAMARYPGGFDWSYTVISRLASLKHNPAGGAWLSGGLLVGMVLLWPVATRIGRRPDGSDARLPLATLRVGLVGGALLAVEGLFTIDLSGIARKAHELLALLTLLGLYTGVLGLFLLRIRRGGRAVWPAVLVMLPLLAVGMSQLALYFDQRDLGWVDTSWREMGVPVWLSFAVWQWLAVAVLGVGLGYLTTTSEPGRSVAESARSGPRPPPRRGDGGLISSVGEFQDP